MSGFIAFVLPIILIFLFFYLLIIRPDKKRKEKLAEQVNSLKVGDKISTFAGIIGRVQKINTEEGTLTITTEGSRVLIMKTAVSQILEKLDDKNETD